FLCHVFHLPETLFLKAYIANRQYFVNNQDFWFEVSCDGEGQTHVHSAGVALNGGINELFDLGKGHDFIELSVDVEFLHPQNSTVEIDVPSAGQLAMKTGSHFKQGTDAAMNLGPTLSRMGNAGEYLEERALSRPVLPDDTQNFSFSDFKGNI